MIEKITELYAFLIDEFGSYSGWNKIWILYPIALLIILLLGKKEEKKIFTGVFVVQIFTIFNPYIANFLVNLIGFESRFRRVMWTVMFYIAIGYAMMLLISLIKVRILRYVLFVMGAVLIISIGTPVFTTEKSGAEYRMMNNNEFVDPEIIAVSEIFHQEGKERPRVLYEDLFTRYRLYDPSVVSVMTRTALLDAAGNDWKVFRSRHYIPVSMRMICKVYLYRNYKLKKKYFYSYIKENNVDYIVAAYPELDGYLSADKKHYTLLGGTPGHRVWKVL